jgi:acetate kinase
MNGTDAICFTGGIGENSTEIRRRTCEGLEALGIKIDLKLNDKAVRGKEMKISTEDSKVGIYVIPTNEELLIARDTLRVVLNAPRVW